MKRFLKGLLVFVLIILTAFLLGPTEKFEDVNNKPLKLDMGIHDIEAYITNKESKVSNIKEDNQARIIWQDSLQKTPYALVYLHGYSASHNEGQPIIQNFAQRYKCNTFLSRLELHGIDDVDAYKDLTPYNWVESAKEAVAIGKILGEKIIVMSTSTGSTLGAFLSANDPDIVAHIMMSPNFDLFDSNSRLLTRPWGKQIMRILSDGNYHYWENPPEGIEKYWTTKNHIQGVVALRSLLDQTMTEDVFDDISAPVFAAYYYRDESAQDDVISVDAIKDFENSISTPDRLKHIVRFENAKGHVIGCDCLNPNWKDVQDSIFYFADNVLGLEVVEQNAIHDSIPLQ